MTSNAPESGSNIVWEEGKRCPIFCLPPTSSCLQTAQPTKVTIHFQHMSERPKKGQMVEESSSEMDCFFEVVCAFGAQISTSVPSFLWPRLPLHWHCASTSHQSITMQGLWDELIWGSVQSFSRCILRSSQKLFLSSGHEAWICILLQVNSVYFYPTDTHLSLCRWSQPNTRCASEPCFSSIRVISTWTSNSTKTVPARSFLSPGFACLVFTSAPWNLWSKPSCRCTAHHFINLNEAGFALSLLSIYCFPTQDLRFSVATHLNDIFHNRLVVIWTAAAFPYWLTITSNWIFLISPNSLQDNFPLV